MEAVNIADNFEEVCEEYEQKSLLLIKEGILESENGSNRFFKGLIFAVPISLIMWGAVVLIFI